MTDKEVTKEELEELSDKLRAIVADLEATEYPTLLVDKNQYRLLVLNVLEMIDEVINV